MAERCLKCGSTQRGVFGCGHPSNYILRENLEANIRLLQNTECWTGDSGKSQKSAIAKLSDLQERFGIDPFGPSLGH